ncbi:MAG: dihydropteroate synthase [Clostridiales bacterium]|nr:dihydropteroate synthase [Clostridiales bacterium]
MGILNVTPDSFFDGGKYNSKDKALEHYLQMIDDGADIIDIGAQSTRPGHIELSAEEELDILKEYLPFLHNEKEFCISVDTFYPEVADYALSNGASAVNDVSGAFSLEMAEIVKKHDCGWVITHAGESDSSHPIHYEHGVLDDINNFFERTLDECIAEGLDREQIVFDPGIGFGKTFDDDLKIIRDFGHIITKQPLLFACSNKRVIGKLSNAEKDDRLFGTITANIYAARDGASIIRVHNVKANRLAMNTVENI